MDLQRKKAMIAIFKPQLFPKKGLLQTTIKHTCGGMMKVYVTNQPNYTEGNKLGTFNLKGHRCGIMICNDGD